jgi:hypothetical protein
MRYQWAIAILWFALVLSYGAWKGNAQLLEVHQFWNSKGEQVYPSVVKSMEQAAVLGNNQYYTGSDGQVYTDIYKQTIQFFNWEVFFQITTFGFGLALLVLIVVRLSARFAKESAINQ